MKKLVSCKVTLMYPIYCTVPFGTLFPPVLGPTLGCSSYKSRHSTLTAHFCMRPSTLTTLLHRTIPIDQFCICPSTTSFFNHDKCMCHCFHASACLLFRIMIVEHFAPCHILMQNKCIIIVVFTESNWSVILLNNSIHNS